MLFLVGKSIILIGQLGMGKFFIINLIVLDVDIVICEILVVFDIGKYIMIFIWLYQMEQEVSIIDLLGFQEFGLYQLFEGMLECVFCDFIFYLGKCCFYNCYYFNELGCVVLEVVEVGEIVGMCYQLYVQLVYEFLQILY